MNGFMICGGTVVTAGGSRTRACGSRIAETADVFGLKGATPW
jgi:hypothetical protein